MGLTLLLATYITKFIASTGHLTVFVGMVLESMVFPIPSEAIMPFTGFLIAEGQFSFWAVIIVSTLGSIVGSLISYVIGYYGGAPFIKKFGKYFLLDQAEFEATNRFFERRGAITVFICRFVPVIRHIISLPAGMARMNLWKFSILTIIGAGLWNTFLAYVGYRLKQNWQLILEYSKTIDEIVVVMLIILVGLYVYRHVRKKNKSKNI